MRDLPDFEAPEDAGLLPKEKLLSGDIPVGLGGSGDGDNHNEPVKDLGEEEVVS